MSTVQFTVTEDKASPTNRVSRGAAITTQAPLSLLFVGDVKTSAGNVITATTTLKAAIDTYSSAIAALAKAKTALGTAVVAWDGSYDVLIAVAEKTCVTDDDGAALGLPIATKTKNVFAMPVSVDVSQDLKKNLVRIHVHRAPGMRTVAVQWTTNLADPTSWKELDGNGARHTIPNPPPGMMWVRAATRTASAKSDFTAPVSVMVK